MSDLQQTLRDLHRDALNPEWRIDFATGSGCGFSRSGVCCPGTGDAGKQCWKV